MHYFLIYKKISELLFQKSNWCNKMLDLNNQAQLIYKK